ncbi:unnamed protein product [Caenorhabditis angaria]|uniref:non-specific serine/threonine protein kinase n=1 Tax=Caenorhabditis angaria TaxID=860376 RepID=A0A9P1IN14_9PELO|nr:unnamed protein product [Caenorhabditis angaria]
MSSDEEMDEGADCIASGFANSIDLASLKQGAEAKLTECVYLGRNAIVKERFQKSYRHPILDSRLNKARTKAELRGIMKAKDLGIQTPAIFFIDGEKNSIIMERIDGPTAKLWIETKRSEFSAEADNNRFQEIIRGFGVLLGEQIGKLHLGGLVHGDLTTSNILLRNSDENLLVFIDFGLSGQGKVTPEEKGVDLYVLERAIASTHINSEQIMIGVLEGYSKASQKQSLAVGKKLDEIRLRGRKRDMIG